MLLRSRRHRGSRAGGAPPVGGPRRPPVADRRPELGRTWRCSAGPACSAAARWWSSAARPGSGCGEVTCTVAATPRRRYELASVEVVLLAGAGPPGHDRGPGRSSRGAAPLDERVVGRAERRRGRPRLEERLKLVVHPTGQR